MTEISPALYSNETLINLAQTHFSLLSRAIDRSEQKSWMTTMEDLLCEIHKRGIELQLVPSNIGKLTCI